MGLGYQRLHHRLRAVVLLILQSTLFLLFDRPRSIRALHKIPFLCGGTHSAYHVPPMISDRRRSMLILGGGLYDSMFIIVVVVRRRAFQLTYRPRLKSHKGILCQLDSIHKMSLDQRMATTLSARKDKGTFRSLKAYDRRQAASSAGGGSCASKKGKERAMDDGGMIDFVSKKPGLVSAQTALC